VYQNDNCTPIFVPNAPSLSGLFDDVIQKSGLSPKDISLVEAHGTGTPVGGMYKAPDQCPSYLQPV
jgi:acyl transferase domain-containing protein